MNKKLLEFALITITVAMFVAPVMAAPATKIDGVTLTASKTTVPNPGYPRVVDHYTIHTKGTSTGTVTLTIPDHPLPEGEWYSEWIGRSKSSIYPTPNPEAEVLIQARVVLTFTGEGTTGTFEGTIYQKTIGWPPPVTQYTYDRMVLHGTGDFQGQTLKLTNDEGTLVMPK